MSICAFCYKPSYSSTWQESYPALVETVTKFIRQIGGQDYTAPEKVSLCQECYLGVVRAVGWREQVGEVERDVRSLQRIILKMMRQLTSLQANYLVEMGKLEGKIRKSQLSHKRRNKIIGTKKVREGVLNVVSELNICRGEISTDMVTPLPNSSSSQIPPPAPKGQNDHPPLIPKVESDPPPEEDPLSADQIDIEHVIYSHAPVKLEPPPAEELAPPDNFILPDDLPPSPVVNTTASSAVPPPVTSDGLPCRFCGKKFETLQSLRNHRKVHGKREKYKCNLCPKAFKTTSSLSYHKQTHAGIKPFQCSVCSKAFGKKQTRDDHVRTQHSGGQKDFSCTLCGRKFAVHRRIRQHMKSKHKISYPTTN